LRCHECANSWRHAVVDCQFQGYLQALSSYLQLTRTFKNIKKNCVTQKLLIYLCNLKVTYYAKSNQQRMGV